VTIAAPLLEERGIRGIFCVPSDFPSVPRAEQPTWFRHNVRPAWNEEHELEADLMGMSWDQVRELARRGHRICSHSKSHLHIDRDTHWDDLEREIVDSRARLEAELRGSAVDGFCWPVEFGQQATAARQLVRRTYKYAFCGGSRPLLPGQDPYAVF